MATLHHQTTESPLGVTGILYRVLCLIGLVTVVYSVVNFTQSFSTSQSEDSSTQSSLLASKVDIMSDNIGMGSTRPYAELQARKKRKTKQRISEQKIQTVQASVLVKPDPKDSKESSDEAEEKKESTDAEVAQTDPPVALPLPFGANIEQSQSASVERVGRTSASLSEARLTEPGLKSFGEEVPLVAYIPEPTPSTTSTGSYYNVGTSAQASTSAQSAALTAIEMNGLTAAIRAVMANGSLSVLGRDCIVVNPADLGQSTCQPEGSHTVPSSRWGIQEGLDLSSLSFSLAQDTNSATGLKAALGLTIQTSVAGQTNPLSVQPVISKVQVSVDSANSKKTFQLSFSDVTLRSSSEKLTAMEATLVFSINGTSSTLLPESVLRFNRISYETLAASFTPQSPNAPLKAGDSYISVSSAPYVISLEKL